MSYNFLLLISLLATINLLTYSVFSWLRIKKDPAFFWFGLSMFAASIAIANNSLIIAGEGNAFLYHISIFVNLSYGAYLILFFRKIDSKKRFRKKLNLLYFLPSSLYLIFVVKVIADHGLMAETMLLAHEGKLTFYGVVYDTIIVLYSIGANLYLLLKEILERKNIAVEKRKLHFVKIEMLSLMLLLQTGAFVPYLLKLDLNYIMLYMPVFGQLYFLYCFYRLSPEKLAVFESNYQYKQEIKMSPP